MPNPQPKLECALCHAKKIDDDLTVEADGTRLCGECWIKTGVESGKFKVREASGEKL